MKSLPAMPLQCSLALVLLLSGCGRTNAPAPDAAAADTELATSPPADELAGSTGQWAAAPDADLSTPPLTENTVEFDLVALQKQEGDIKAAIRAGASGRQGEVLLQRQAEVEAKIRQLQSQMRETVGNDQ